MEQTETASKCNGEVLWMEREQKSTLDGELVEWQQRRAKAAASAEPADMSAEATVKVVGGRAAQESR